MSHIYNKITKQHHKKGINTQTYVKLYTQIKAIIIILKEDICLQKGIASHVLHDLKMNASK